jgi:hypothetical protein
MKNKEVFMLREIVILSGFLFSISANAGLVTYDYSGTISSLYEAKCKQTSNGGCDGYDIEHSDSSNMYLDYIFSVGDTFSGSFTYETQATLSGISSDGYQAIYSDGVISQSFTLGSYYAPSAELAGGEDGNLSIVNGRYGTDVFQTGSYYSNSEWFSGATVSLQDNTDSIFNDMSIPNELDFNGFHYKGFSLFFLDRSTNDQLQLRGNITSLVKAPINVPEPNSIWLFCLALLSVRNNLRAKKYGPITS